MQKVKIIKQTRQIQNQQSTGSKSSQITEHKIQRCICKQCAFEITVQLSQQILQLRQRIVWYQKQNKQMQKLNLYSQQFNSILQPIKITVQKQLIDQNKADEQILQLQNQLKQLQTLIQTQKQNQNQNQFDKHIKQLNIQFINIYSKVHQNQHQYAKQLNYYHNTLLHKDKQLNTSLQLLSKTNFVTIFYSITFNNNYSYLNGQKIQKHNVWKVIQIVFFYQQKYQNYKPIATVIWSDMLLQTQLYLQSQQNTNQQDKSFANKQNQQKYEKVQYIPINCDTEQLILNYWMKYFLLQVKHLFNYLNKSIGCNSKLHYQINNYGQFSNLQDQIFTTQKDKFNAVVKYLMNNLNQINKLQFFAKQHRINASLRQNNV